VWNFCRIISEDKEELEKTMGAAASTGSIGKADIEKADPERNATATIPPPPPPANAVSPPPTAAVAAGAAAAAAAAAGTTSSPSSHHRHGHRPHGVKSPSSGISDSNGGCYVPDGGFPLNTDQRI
jgi:phage tail tape-measure protein